MKKIKKYHIVLFIFLILLLLIAVSGIYLNNASFSMIMVSLLLIIEYLLIYLENKKRNKIVKSFIVNKEYDKALEVLKLKKDKCLFRGNNIAVVSDMIVINAVKGNLYESSLLIKEYNLYNNNSLYYVLFQIALSENNLAKAKVYSEKILEIKKEKYLPQQQSVKAILKMIETGGYDENILNNTQYPFIKELCLKYQNGEKVDFEENSNLDIDTKNVKNKKRSISILGIVLLILSIVGLYSLLIIMTIYAPTTHIELQYVVSTTFKFAWIIIIIPITSIIFGFVFRKKGYKTLGNIIVGFIALLFLLVMGILSLSFDVEKINDTRVLKEFVIFEDMEEIREVDIYFVDGEYNKQTFIRFYNHLEFNDLYMLLEDNCQNALDVLIDEEMIDKIGIIRLIGSDQFVLYSVDDNMYGFDYIEYNQKYLIVQIDVEAQVMLINEIFVEK